MIHRTKQLTGLNPTIIFEVPTRLHRDFLVQLTGPTFRKFMWSFSGNSCGVKCFRDAQKAWRRGRQWRASASLAHCRTQSVLKRRAPHPARLTRALLNCQCQPGSRGKTVHPRRKATSYFDPGWNAFAQQKDGSIQRIPEHIIGIGENFHSQVEDGKVKTTLYKVRWIGYKKTG